MQPKRAILRLFFFCLLMTSGLAGCRPAPVPNDVTTPERRSIDLRIACPNEETASLLRSRGRSWALRQEVKIAIQIYDPSKDTEQQNQHLANSDVWIIAPTDLSQWAAAGKLAPLPNIYKAPDNPLAWSDLLPTWREQLVQWDGKAFALPLFGEAPLCCYRADLLKAPAHQSALQNLVGRDFNGPLTWEQFAQVAEHFRAKGMSGQPGPSLPPLPRDDAELDRLFYTVAAGFARRAVRDDEERSAYSPDDVFSFHYNFETGQPRLTAPGFVHALKLLQRLQACRPAECADHPEEAFLNGRAVLCLTDAPWLVTFQKAPALRDKVGVCRIPGGDRYFDFRTGQERKPFGPSNWLPYLGGAGWLAVVSSSSRNTEAAFELLADLAGPKTSTQIFLGSIGKGGPTRSSQLYRHRWDTFDLDEKQTMRLRDFMEETLLHRNWKNPVLCLRTPRQAAHRAVLVRGLREALLKGADAEKTLQNVAAEWSKLDHEQGLAEHKADYRRSLGLLANE